MIHRTTDSMSIATLIGPFILIKALNPLVRLILIVNIVSECIKVKLIYFSIAYFL